MSQQWKVRAVEETNTKTFAARLQSALNSMQRQGLQISVERSTVAEAASNGGKFVAIVTGFGDVPTKSETKPAVEALPVASV